MELQYNPIEIGIKNMNHKFINFLVYPDWNSRRHNRKHLPLFEKLQELTHWGSSDIFYAMNYAYVPEMWIPQAIIQANRLGMEIVNIFYIGTSITDSEVDFIDKIIEYHINVKEELHKTNDKFVLAGEIEQNNIYPEFKRSYILVNIDNYILHGCPRFIIEPELHYTYCCTHYDEFERGTAHGLWPDTEKMGKQIPPPSLGWSAPAISTILSWGTPVLQLPETITKELHTVPWDEDRDYWQDVYCDNPHKLKQLCYDYEMDPQYEEVRSKHELNKIIPPEYGGKAVPFILNTEDYIEEKRLADDYKLTNVITIAAGFKFINLIDVLEHTEDCKIIFYDYNKQTLGLKKHIMDKWDGKSDLKEFLTKEYPKLVKEYWNDYAWFRDQRDLPKLQSLFLKSRKWDNEYHCLDILHDLDSFLDIIPDEAGTVVFVSNIFDFVQNWILGTLTLTEIWIKFIRHLQTYENDILIIGADPQRNTIFDFAKNIGSIRPNKLHTWES